MHVIFTSAYLKSDYERRKNEYLSCIRQLNNFNIVPNIVECVSSSETYEKEQNANFSLFYSNTHNDTIKNKGVLEIYALRKYLNSTVIESEYTSKITGRYYPENKQIFDDPTGYDGICKYDNYGQIFTGYFCLKTKLFNEFIKNVDTDTLEKNMINIEQVLADFIKYKNLNMKTTKQLNIKASIFGSGKRHETYW